jgi:hypothetical protein
MALNVYYSISPFGTGDIKTGSPNISITSGVATLSVAQTGNIGQGVCIEYNSLKCYISQVNSPTSFNVVTAIGGTPSDQSSTTVTSIHHEYASLSAAEAGAPDADHITTANLITADVVLNFCCYYDHDDQTADTTAVTINSYTTDETRFILVFTPTGGVQSINSQRHSGAWSASKYRIIASPATTFDGVIKVLDDYVRVSGLQIENDATTTGVGCCVYSGNGIILSESILWLYTSNAGYLTDLVGSIASSIYNCLGIGSGTGTGGRGFLLRVSGSVIYNCTVYGSAFARAIWSYGTEGVLTAINCAVFGTGDDFYGTFASIDHCASDDGDGTNAVTPADWSAVFTDYANGDFSLKSGSALIGAGIDNPGSGLYSDDIIGNARSSVWDIGAFEYVTAGSGTTIQAEASDGVVFTDTSSRTKRIFAGCVDGISMGDSGGNLAQLMSTASDGIALSDAVSRTARIATIVADGILSGDGCSVSKLASVLSSDGISLADQAGVVAALSVSMEDGISFSDTSSVAAYLRSIASDGIIFSDVLVGDLLGIIVGLVADGISFSDSTQVRAGLYAAASDSVRFGDVVTTVLRALAQASDGIIFSDDATWAMTIQALAADGITLSDSAIRILRKAVYAIDGITLTDSNGVNAIFQVIASDGIEFLSAVSVIARLGVMASDGIRISDSTVAGSPWTRGKVTMTMTFKHSTLTFTISKSTAEFELKKPSTTFTLN